MSPKPPRSMGRRRLLRGLGAAAASLPFLSSFGARAQVGGALPKLLIFASPNAMLVGPRGGSGFAGWAPAGVADGTSAVDVNLDDPLRGVLAPLDSVKQECLFLDGIRGTQRVGSHQQAVALLTGAGVYQNEIPRAAGGDGEFYAEGMSVDQRIAGRLGCNVLGLSYRIQGFNLGEGYISHLGPNQGFTPIQNPGDAFSRVFGAPSDDAVAADARQRRQQSVLDRVASDLSGLRGRLPSSDRARLDEHLSHVRAIEQGMTASGGCGDGGAGPGSYDASNSANMPRLMRDYSQIMVQAFACGYTQVGFLQFGNLGGNHRPQWSEFDAVTTYSDHAIAHAFQGVEGAGSAGLSRAEGIRLGVNVQRFYNAMIAETIQRLADTTDVDGSRMLDNTIVLHIKQMGENHNRRRLFWMVAGGRNLGVRGGRYVRLPSDRHYYNDLHVALCHKMGLEDVATHGDASQNRGPLDLG